LGGEEEDTEFWTMQCVWIH